MTEKNSWGGSRKGAGRPRRDIDLVETPIIQTDTGIIPSKSASISARAAYDSAVMGYGSSIDIPRTPLSRGAKFGETITPQGLRFATRREPLAKRLITDIAEDIFDKWFKIQPITAGEKEDAKNTLDESAQKLLESLNAKFNFIRAAQYEREFGWSIIILGYKDSNPLDTPVENPSEIDHLAVYSPRSTTVEKEDEDPQSERFGLPIIYKIDRGKNQYLRVHYSRVLHVATRLDEHPYAGVSVLENIWDDMTVYRNIRWASGQVYWRMPGLMVFTLPKDYSAAEIQNFFASLGDPNVRTFMGLPEDKKLDILGSKGKVLTPDEFIDPIIRSICMGAGVPKQKLEGTEAGAVTGSEVNQREYYKYVSNQQKMYEAQIVGPLIDKLMLIKQLTPDIDYTVEWESSFELDIATKNAAALSDAQAATNQLKYMTIDEVRALRSLKPLSEVTSGREDGQVLAAPQSPSISFNDPSLPDKKVEESRPPS